MKPSENYTTHFIEMKNDRENKKKWLNDTFLNGYGGIIRQWYQETH